MGWMYFETLIHNLVAGTYNILGAISCNEYVLYHLLLCSCSQKNDPIVN